MYYIIDDHAVKYIDVAMTFIPQLNKNSAPSWGTSENLLLGKSHLRYFLKEYQRWY